MTPRSADRAAAGRRTARRATAVVGLLAVLGWALAGCGDPDDDGGGGGGYLAQQPIGQSGRR